MSYIFDPDTLFEISKKGVGLQPKEMVRTVSDELARAYPGHVEPRPDWMFNMAAGAVGVMTILHGSLSEYLIIFGSAIGTSGFSGRYLVEIHDFVMGGEMRTYTEDNVLEPIITRTGERAMLRRDQTKGFKISDETWLLEYGRGLIPTTLPLALCDGLISCMDVYTVAKTLTVYGKHVFRELRQGKL
jgi:hypothetical protein